MLTRFQKTLAVILSLLGWFALLAQLYLIVENRNASIVETVIRYFSFFTILTNLLVVVCCTILLLKQGTKAWRFFSAPSTLTALAVYITVVGMVYNIVLRFLWDPQGLQFVVDELLHSVIPVLFIIFWLISIKGVAISWKNIFPWMIYPLAYFIYILIFGAFSGFYPYPFINVADLGYGKVLINSVLLLFGFFLLALFFVWIRKQVAGKAKHNLHIN